MCILTIMRFSFLLFHTEFILKYVCFFKVAPKLVSITILIGYRIFLSENNYHNNSNRANIDENQWTQWKIVLNVLRKNSVFIH